eukprot:CAMPEP_0119405320 /NCGR_PEP_ID=MMETSP1334-20130426/144339_1 /TAXON_ID=127549 /ORGANISM="Calcidiscus leptoporus, Strain RCC1130" /LENGTH=64 /DNA_ID=CAMNT_0007429291 /DNA_START=372 /DNA_END=566 /DNA_ORIENTATION=-
MRDFCVDVLKRHATRPAKAKQLVQQRQLRGARELLQERLPRLKMDGLREEPPTGHASGKPTLHR